MQTQLANSSAVSTALVKVETQLSTVQAERDAAVKAADKAYAELENAQDELHALTAELSHLKEAKEGAAVEDLQTDLRRALQREKELMDKVSFHAFLIEKPQTPH